MNEKVVLEIASGIITILVAMITRVLIPYIKSKISAEKLYQINTYIEKAIRAAEQLYTPDEWLEKKEYVTSYITKVINEKYKMKFSEEDIDNLIEGTVNLIKHGSNFAKTIYGDEDLEIDSDALIVPNVMYLSNENKNEGESSVEDDSNKESE